MMLCTWPNCHHTARDQCLQPERAMVSSTVDQRDTRIAALEAQLAVADRLAGCMDTVKDYVTDTASGALQYRNRAPIQAMAVEDTVRIEAALAAYRAIRGRGNG